MNIKVVQKLSELSPYPLIIPVIKDRPASPRLLGKKLAATVDNSVLQLPSAKEPEKVMTPEGRLLILIPIKSEIEADRDYIKMGSKIAGLLKKHKLSKCALIALESAYKTTVTTSLSLSIIEGLYAGAYTFNRYKTEENFSIETLEVLSTQKKVSKAIQNRSASLQITFDNVALARDLVNTPAADLTPAIFAETVRATATDKMTVTVMDEAQLQSNGLNLIYTVGKGSVNRPFLVKISYTGNPNTTENIALVGKGVTFDSGGTNLKPSGSIETMKMDMAGAATMFAVAKAIHDLDLPINVHTYLPLVENTIGYHAYRPGDILTSASGKTIEIWNTDAEGRLILADALHEATKTDPALIIDAATLTGACITALGSFCAGMCTTDVGYMHKMIQISNHVGEDVWPLPLFKDYESRLKGELAELRNIPKQKGEAGTTTAALFLKEFVGDTPWMHLDIAGPAHLAEPHPILGSGGSGFGVRLLLNFITEQFTTLK